MAKKTGRKADYIMFGGEEVKTVLNGRDIGVVKDKTTDAHYVMIPQKKGRTKRRWLGQDVGIAVAKFWAIVGELQGQHNNDIITEIEMVPPLGSGEYLAKYNMPVSETQYIEWLKKELQDTKALARKTGIPEFVEFGKLLSKDTNIPLKDIIENYLNKKKSISQKTKDDSKTWFKTFVSVIDCQHVDDITLPDIHKFEDLMHESGLAPKTIKNRMDCISTIFNYNTGRYDNTHLIQVHRWLKGLDRPEQTAEFNPKLMSLDHFNTLYKNADLKWKAMLLLGLNCAMYPIDLSRLKKENIDFENGTIAFRRGKTGKVLAVSTLWTRTKRALKKYLDSRKDNSPYVFLNLYKTNYKDSSGITNYFNESLRHRSGIPKKVQFNHLRDTFSTLAQDKGYTIEQINLVLGHINKGMQDRYAVRHANKLTGAMCRAVEREFFSKKK